MSRVNETAAALCTWLRGLPEVEEVHHPLFRDRARYDAFRRADGGYSGLFSLLLKDAPATTPRFFDRLQISKGPNLGTTFSLACPYTMLAHFDELDWAERCGVSRYLIRFSVGLEDTEILKDRISSALRDAK
jgi:cystathionine gamma-synthase